MSDVEAVEVPAYEIARKFCHGGEAAAEAIRDFVRSAIAVERDQCAALAIHLHGCDGDQIADAIRARSNEH